MTARSRLNLSLIFLVCLSSSLIEAVAHGQSVVESESTSDYSESIGRRLLAFPTDAFSAQQLSHGAVILHVICALVCFYGLSVISDAYIEPLLNRASAAMKLSEDVAGATVAALGGSTPETFIMIFATFISKSDLGISTVFGSSGFNELVVVSFIAMAAPGTKVSKWAIARDTFAFCLSIFVFVAVSSSGIISWWNCLVMLAVYFVYLFALMHNDQFSAYASDCIRKFKAEPPNGSLSAFCRWVLCSRLWNLFIYTIILLNIIVALINVSGIENTTLDDINAICKIVYLVEISIKWIGYDFFVYWTDPFNAFDGFLVYLILLEQILSSNVSAGVRTVRLFRLFRGLRVGRGLRLFRACFEPKSANDMESPCVAPEGQTVSVLVGAEQPPAADDDDDNGNAPYSFLERPSSSIGKTVWVIFLPVNILIWLTVPDWRKPGRGAIWMLPGAVMAISWAGALCFMLSWTTVTISNVIHVPENVMGLIWVAFGCSIPDTLQSVNAGRKGQGDAAISSSLGSNVINVCLVMPIVWLFYNGIIFPGTDVVLLSTGMVTTVMVILVCLAIGVITIHFFGWKLTRGLGMATLFIYSLFLLFAILIETNVF